MCQVRRTSLFLVGHSNRELIGHAPIWQNIPLPIAIPNDRKNPSGPKPIWTVPKNQFQQVFQATALMRPDFRFNDADVVTTRNSLRKLLKFCGGLAQDPFKVHVSLVENTLFIEQYHITPMRPQETGWGHSFETAFAKFPPGLEDSTSHDRFLRYPIGDLNCVVGFEVDACYEDGGRKTDQEPLEELQADLEQLSLGNSEVPLNSTPPGLPEQPHGAKIMKQSTAAEMKTSRAGKTSITTFLPQLWFGRTPWLIVGSHIEGTFLDTKVTNVEERLKQWETERQDELRKLVTLLAELREVLRDSGGQRLAVIYDRGGTPRVLRMYRLAEQRKVVDANFVRQFWA